MSENDVDVGNLPTIAFGPHTPLWWAEMLTIMILSAMMVTLISSYLYLRLGLSGWASPDSPAPSLLLPTICFVVLLITNVPIYRASKAVQRGDRRRTTYGLALNFVLAIVFLVLRVSSFKELGFEWYSSVYASLVWIIMAFHTILTITAAVWTGILLGIVLSNKDGEKHQLGIEVDAWYWGFLALSWIPFYFLLFVYPATLLG